MIRRFKNISVILIIIVVILIIFLEFGAKLFYRETELKEFESRIVHSEKLSRTFYYIHDKLYNSRQRNVRIALFNALLGRKGEETNSYDFKTAKIIDTVQTRIQFPKLALAFYLNRKIGIDKCFDYYTFQEFENFEHFNQRNYKLKNLHDTTQILEFLIMKKAPHLYANKTDFVKQEIEKLRIKLNKE